MSELQILVNKLNEEGGIDRFERRCERENFKQWFEKFQADHPSISVSEPITDNDPSQFEGVFNKGVSDEELERLDLIDPDYRETESK